MVLGDRIAIFFSQKEVTVLKMLHVICLYFERCNVIVTKGVMYVSGDIVDHIANLDCFIYTKWFRLAMVLTWALENKICLFSPGCLLIGVGVKSVLRGRPCALNT